MSGLSSALFNSCIILHPVDPVNFLSHSLIIGHIGYIQCLIVRNHAAMKLEILGHELLSALANVFVALIPRIRITQSKIMIIF